MSEHTEDKYKTRTVRAGQEDRMKKRGYILMDSDSSGKETGSDHGKRHKRKKIKRKAVYMKPGTPKGSRVMY